MAKKKEKCNCPDPGLTAPFYMLTYGDIMTLLLCFFILLFAMSTLEVKKFQSKVAIMQSSLGISKQYQHAPMQKNLPAPAIKQQVRVIARARTAATIDSSSLHEESSIPTADPDSNAQKKQLQAIQTLGQQAGLEVTQLKSELIMTLPLHGIFDKGEWEINPKSPDVQRVKPIYANIAKRISHLVGYDITFVGHTDIVAIKPKTTGPKSNTELGFLRAMSMYEYFFSPYLTDKTRIVFASQGDNIPIIANARLDSEHRKNRRVVIHLKKREEPTPKPTR